METAVRAGTEAGSAIVTVGTGGTVIVVTAGTAVVGAGAIAHGTAMAITAGNNFASQKGRVSEKEHGGGKNDKHQNQNARKSAEKRYNDANSEYEKLKNKPGARTKEEKQQMEKLKNSMKHEQKKMDETGETHHRK